MGFNSTIRVKEGKCSFGGCQYYGPLAKGQCPTHYWGGIRMKSAIKQEEFVLTKDESLATVVSDLDAVFSKYIRLKDADENGYAICVTCGDSGKWTLMECGHFISRSHMYTRFSELNCACQCHDCNSRLRGNIIKFSQYLESIRPGSVELLTEHGQTIYRYSITELKSMISDYTHKVKLLKNGKPN